MATSYAIIESCDTDDLAREVQKRMRAGWVLQGGVSSSVVLDVAHGIFRYNYAQAMTKQVRDRPRKSTKAA